MYFCFSLSVPASDLKKKVTFVQLFPRPGPDDPYVKRKGRTFKKGKRKWFKHTIPNMWKSGAKNKNVNWYVKRRISDKHVVKTNTDLL